MTNDRRRIPRDLELRVLRKVFDDSKSEETRYSPDSSDVGGLEYIANLVDVGLVDGVVSKCSDGKVGNVSYRGLTYAGGIRLAELEEAAEQRRLSSRIKKLMGRAVWAILGIPGTLFVQWLKKKLGLS